jgi:hypothetical protein
VTEFERETETDALTSRGFALYFPVNEQIETAVAIAAPVRCRRFCQNVFFPGAPGRMFVEPPDHSAVHRVFHRGSSAAVFGNVSDYGCTLLGRHGHNRYRDSSRLSGACMSPHGLMRESQKWALDRYRL